MKKINVKHFSLLLFLVILMLSVLVGCTSEVQGLEVNTTEIPTEIKKVSITSVADVKNLVTDDNKLVINYYDSYIWTVFFDSSGKIENMYYIYKFEDSDMAADMVEKRTHELERNKTMTVTEAYPVENYLVVNLVDTSYDNVKREILENNFKNLIVY